MKKIYYYVISIIIKKSIIIKVLEISAKCACFVLVLMIRTGDLKFVLLWNFRIYVEPESNKIESNRTVKFCSISGSESSSVRVQIWFGSYSYRRDNYSKFQQ